LLDVNQHNAVVKGHIDNPGGRLRAGQFVSCTVQLPPPEGVVEIPISAVVDDGRQAGVFVQPDAARPQFTPRRIDLTHRLDRTALVRSALPPGQPARTPPEKAEDLLPRRPLRHGERVLATGVLELKKELEDLQAKAPQ